MKRRSFVTALAALLSAPAVARAAPMCVRREHVAGFSGLRPGFTFKFSDSPTVWIVVGPDDALGRPLCEDVSHMTLARRRCYADELYARARSP